MTNEAAPPVNFTGAANWTEYTGEGGVDLVPFEGFVQAKVVKATAVKSKSSPNWNAKINLVVEDDDAKGMRLIKDVPYTGTRGDGKPNVLGFLDFLRSTGTEKEKIIALEGQSMDVSAVLETVVGRIAHCDIGAKEYQGKVSTEIRNFITKDRFEKAKKIGSHRRDLPAKFQHAVGGTQQQASGGNAVNGQQAATNAAASAL